MNLAWIITVLFGLLVGVAIGGLLWSVIARLIAWAGE
jgi:hypothetical protein